MSGAAILPDGVGAFVRPQEIEARPGRRGELAEDRGAALGFPERPPGGPSQFALWGYEPGCDCFRYRGSPRAWV